MSFTSTMYKLTDSNIRLKLIDDLEVVKRIAESLSLKYEIDSTEWRVLNQFFLDAEQMQRKSVIKFE